MDRAVLVMGAIVAAVLIGLGALSSLADYARPVFVNGSATASQIDDVMGSMIAARFPDVAVGRAHCPVVLNLTGKRTALCGLPVAAGEMRVRIAIPNEGGYPPPFQNLDALFVTREAERTIAARFAEQYGEPFDVRCPGAAVRVVADHTSVTCSIEAPDVLRRGVDVGVSGQDGDVRVPDLASVPTRAARVFGREIAEQKEGSVAIPGRAMESYVLGSASADAGGAVGRRGLTGAAHCPPHIVLYEGGLTTCTVRVGGLVLTYDVHFEKGPGLYVQARKQIEVVALLRDIATRYFERPQYTGGKPLAAYVDCGAARVAFVEPGSSVPCTAKVGNDTHSFTFEISDAEGHFSIVDD